MTEVLNESGEESSAAAFTNIQLDDPEEDSHKCLVSQPHPVDVTLDDVSIALRGGRNNIFLGLKRQQENCRILVKNVSTTIKVSDNSKRTVVAMQPVMMMKGGSDCCGI